MRRLPIILTLAGFLLAQRPPTEAAWDLLAKGDRPAAIRLLHEIITANPRDADARLLLGSVLMEQGERSESIAQLTEAVRLLPQSAEAGNALGEAFKTFDDPKAARRAFEKAVALDPRFAPARVNLGLILVDAGEFGASAEHLDRAIRILGHTPDAALPHYLRAKVYTEQNAVDKAAAQLQEAVSLRPDFAEAWSDLGQARKTLLDDAGALAAFARAVELSPDDAVAQYRLGAEYLRMAKIPEAIEHLQVAAKLNSDDQSALYSLQLALREDGQLEPARQVKEKLAELLRKRDKASEQALTAVQINNQGAELEKAGDLRGALEKYRAALDLNPEHVGIRTNLAVALLRSGQWSQGIAELREALRRDPGNTALQKALDDALAQAKPVQR
jgi:protein O-GlcNAc transferase